MSARLPLLGIVDGTPLVRNPIISHASCSAVGEIAVVPHALSATKSSRFAMFREYSEAAAACVIVNVPCPDPLCATAYAPGMMELACRAACTTVANAAPVAYGYDAIVATRMDSDVP